MAHELLRKPKTPHLPYHDIESFFWVVFYATILWFALKTNNETAILLIRKLFDDNDFDPSKGEITGGILKRVSLIDDDRVDSTILPPTSILYAWFKKFRVLCLRLDTDLFERPTVEKTFKIFSEAWRAVLEDESLTTENRFVRKGLIVETSNESDIIAVATRYTGSFMPKAGSIPSTISLPTIPFLQGFDVPWTQQPSTAPVMFIPPRRRHESDNDEL